MEEKEPKNILIGIEPIPHIGIYEKDDYKMMGKLFISYTPSFPSSDCSLLPPQLQRTLANLENNKQIIFKSKTAAIQYFDGSTFKINENYLKHSSCRLNYVLHPLIFGKKTTHYEEKVGAKACLYTLDHHEFGLIECKKENQHLCFNFDEIFDKATFFEVHVHMDDKNWLLSPNNAAFQTIISEPLTTFIILNIFQDYQGDYHMLLTWNTIIWEDKCEIVNGVINSFLFENEMNNKNNLIFESALKILTDNTNEFVEKILNFFKDNSEKPDQFMKEFTKFLSVSFNNSENNLMDAIYHFIQKKFHGTKVNNFGYEFLNSCSFELKKAILANYFKFYINNYLTSLCMQCSMLDIDYISIVKQETDIFKKIETQISFNHDFIERKPLHEMVSYVLDGNFDLINKIMENNIFKPLESYIYEQTWIYKGKIQGISGEFGRYSFLNNKKINEVYHCRTEECCEILMLVDGILESL